MERRIIMKKIIFVLILIAVVVGINVSGLTDFLTLESIKANKDLLVGMSSDHAIVFVLGVKSLF